MNDVRKVARIFKALSEERRLSIVKLLRKRSLCVNAIAARLGITQGAVSQHLRILRDSDLVLSEKRGFYVHYRINEKTMKKWKGAIERFLREESD